MIDVLFIAFFTLVFGTAGTIILIACLLFWREMFRAALKSLRERK